MGQERIETGKQPVITVAECHGDLVVRSWAETAVLIKGDDYEVKESEAGLTLISKGSIKLTIPLSSSLAVNVVQGDLSVKKVAGPISLRHAAQDVSLNQVGAVKIGIVQGDLSAKQVDGSLSAETILGDAAIRRCDDLALGTIHGDLSARNVAGAVDIAEVMGDVSLRSVSGDITVKQGMRDANLRGLDGTSNTLNSITGDIRLRGQLKPGRHTFQAGGDIVLHWPEEAEIDLTAVAPQIDNRLPSLENTAVDGHTLTGQIGAGEAVVSLTAGGCIVLRELHPGQRIWGQGDFVFDEDFNFDMNGFNEMINSQVLDQVNRITANLERRFGTHFSEQMADKIARKAEKAAAKAERAAERAVRLAERKMHQSWPSWPTTAPQPPRPFKASSPKAAAEEQLKILKMVEKGVISPEEASTLLDALES